ncbi:hypothetical protein ANN_16017 [Periplaneta americana]|uniref:Uncharacterized protein n=1 Tax=Periplaneta americana TaxID=6978 RepID=A0ABQ8SHW1_PERAM|nr:hypothetical protein ANN_16017 [Periplaneta americana]
MSPGSSTESYPAFARIGLRENPGKNLNQVTCPDRDSNPGHLVLQPDALTVTPQNLLSSSLLSKSLKVRIYKTVILSVVLYGCETWTLTLREEQRLRVFENKVLRKIFGAKRDEVTGEWRKLHNAELHALYTSPDIIRNIKSRRLKWAGHVARMGEFRNAYRVLVGRPEGKIPLGRPRRRWEYDIKMDLREVGYDGRDWINLAQDRDQWRTYLRAAMNLRVPCDNAGEMSPGSNTESYPAFAHIGLRENPGKNLNQILKATRVEDSRTCGLVIKARAPTVSESVSVQVLSWTAASKGDRSSTCSEQHLEDLGSIVQVLSWTAASKGDRSSTCSEPHLEDLGSTCSEPHLEDRGSTCSEPHLEDRGSTCSEPHLEDRGSTCSRPHLGDRGSTCSELEQ